MNIIACDFCDEFCLNMLHRCVVAYLDANLNIVSIDIKGETEGQNRGWTTEFSSCFFPNYGKHGIPYTGTGHNLVFLCTYRLYDKIRVFAIMLNRKSVAGSFSNWWMISNAPYSYDRSRGRCFLRLCGSLGKGKWCLCLLRFNLFQLQIICTVGFDLFLWRLALSFFGFDIAGEKWVLGM